MNRQTLMKVLDIQDAALQDEEYQTLYAEYEPIHQRFLQLLRGLDPRSRDILTDYLGVTGAMHLRLMALSVENPSPTISE